MKQIKLLAILFLATISFTSCSDDDSSGISYKGEYTAEGETFKFVEASLMQPSTEGSTSTVGREFILSTDRINLKDGKIPYLSKNGQNTLFFSIYSTELEGTHYATDFGQAKTLIGSDGLYQPNTIDYYSGVRIKITKNKNTYKIEFSNETNGMEKLVGPTQKKIKGEFNGELKIIEPFGPF